MDGQRAGGIENGGERGIGKRDWLHGEPLRLREGGGGRSFCRPP
jgi:hypothetical protein